jgi:FixJ family two-component response regulator
MGAVDFFAKPFENQALLRLVRATLDQAKVPA